MKNHYKFYQDTTDNMVSMICLNPVTVIDDSVKRGLFATDTNVLSKLQDKTFKEILLMDATMEEGEDAVVAHFKVTKEWEKLNRNYRQKQGKDLIGYKQYYELLFLVKSSSMVDHVLVVVRRYPKY